MAEYIEREALMEKIEQLTIIINGLRGGKDVLAEFGIRYKNSILRAINDFPAADVVERKRGEWVSRFARHWKGRDECDQCGFHEKDRRDLSQYNFCPNCGCQMGGG